MAINKIPTSADIFLEIGGKRVAVVQSYKVITSRTARDVHAFGQEQPVATIQGVTHYELELSRVYATDAAIADGMNFHTMADFSLVVSRDGKRVIYSGCQWKRIEESAEVGGFALEKVTLTATGRLVEA